MNKKERTKEIPRVIVPQGDVYKRQGDEYVVGGGAIENDWCHPLSY